MKKISYLFVLLLSFICIINVNAKEQTLNELKAAAEANRKAYNEAKNQKALTEEQKQQTSEQKAEVENEINDINSQISKIEEEIKEKQDDIKKKDDEIKQVVKFAQVSEDKDSYLDYIFGANSFTDFIYRVSVAEQLSNYNDKLIKEYEQDVKDLDAKQQELTSKQDELNKKQQELSVLEAKLDQDLETIQEGMMSKDEEYNNTVSMIKSLTSLGCSGNQTLSQCKTVIARRYSSSGSSSGGQRINVSNVSGVYLPLLSGYVTSGYGQRTGEFHTGVDMATGSVSTVYPVAKGVVTYVRYGSTSTCGNHIIYIYHPDLGYTTSYWHLTTSYVSKGQSVDPGTPIGQIGGHGYHDPCAFGGHVHLNLFYGLTTSNSGRINPGILVPIPATGSYFTSPR